MVSLRLLSCAIVVGWLLTCTPVAAQSQTDDDKLEPEDLALGRAHRRQLADFVDAVTDGRPPRVGTAEARTSLSVILAMYESAATGRPVTLPTS